MNYAVKRRGVSEYVSMKRVDAVDVTSGVVIG